MMTKRFWAELKSSEFAGLDPDATVAILPVASTEQHGPHLPVMTDTAIAEGLIKTVLARLPDDLKVLILPTQTIGKSDEHLRSPGTIRSEEHTSELQSQSNLVCRLLLEKKKQSCQGLV